jgi:hypothetical protein
MLFFFLFWLQLWAMEKARSFGAGEQWSVEVQRQTRVCCFFIMLVRLAIAVANKSRGIVAHLPHPGTAPRRDKVEAVAQGIVAMVMNSGQLVQDGVSTSVRDSVR